jgi:histidyl-tRNA synthetase
MARGRISTIVRYCFTELGLKGVTVKSIIEKILSGIAEVIGASDKLIDFTVALDKLIR